MNSILPIEDRSIVKKVILTLLPGITALLLLFLLLKHSGLPSNPGKVSAEISNDQADDILFSDSGQKLGNSTSRGVALGDLDGDNDLDALVANNGVGNRLWLNDGDGFFVDSGQNLGNSATYGVGLGKLNNDDYLDAYFANYNQPNTVWLNDGQGSLTNTNQTLGSGPSYEATLGFINDDALLDVFVANGSASSSANEVWLNIGGGVFTNSLPSLGSSWSEAAALGNLDTDSDVDVFIANGGSSNQPPDEVWLNIGGGIYTDTGQALGAIWSTDAALANLDEDADLDAFTTSWFPVGNKVWINNGSGTFSDSGQLLGTDSSTSVALGDLDGDLDADALVGNWLSGSQIWVNDGSGSFSQSGAALGTDATWDLALGDLDGDGDLDVFMANQGPNTVWFNGEQGLPGATINVSRQTNDSGQDVFYSSSTKIILPIMLARAAPKEMDVHIRVDSPSNLITETITLTTGQQLVMVELQSSFPDPVEEFKLSLFVTPTGIDPESGDATDMLSLYFVNPVEGPRECFLCFNSWLGWQSGFIPIFDALHHFELVEQRDTPQWRYYSTLLKIYTPEMVDIVASHPKVLWKAMTTFNNWTPAVEFLNDGSGSQSEITQNMVDNANDLLKLVKDEATPTLRTAIEYEQNSINMNAFVNLDMDQAWDKFSELRPNDQIIISIILKSAAPPLDH